VHPSTAEMPQKDDHVNYESSDANSVENVQQQAGAANDSRATAVETDGMMQPVTLSSSREIGPEGGTVKFESSDVILVVPQGAVMSATKFSLKTYVEPAFLPPTISKDEVTLSPAFHVSSSQQLHHQFEKPLQLSLPVEVPLTASISDSGWLLKLKKSESSSGMPSEWDTVLELNTKTGDVVSHSSFVDFDFESGTLQLTQFSWLAWLGEALTELGTMLGITSLRGIHYAVFGKKIKEHKWLVAAHIIHGSRVVYEFLVQKLREMDYVELTYPKADCIQIDGEICLRFQCLEPWQVQQGRLEVQFTTNQIWSSEQHCSCYHEIMIEDGECSAEALECKIGASFWANRVVETGESSVDGSSLELLISHPLKPFLRPSARTELLPDSIVFQAVLRYGVDQWSSIGLAMGFTGAQITAYTAERPAAASKLEELIERKCHECGIKETEEILRAACEKIPQPIIGAVNSYLEDIRRQDSFVEDTD
jgi:hypothetical protein